MSMSTFLLFFCILFSTSLLAQNPSDGVIGGNFQIDVQSYKPDSLIGAQNVPEKVRSNAFLNLNYTKGDFSAGIRYESYLKEILGFSPNWGGKEGNAGIGYRYARYRNDDIDVTIGNFYEQFGNGMILRTYEERGLGLDNALDGVRAKLNMIQGMQITGIFGKQRSFFSVGPGIVRGIDGEILVEDFLKNFGEHLSIMPDGWRLRFGGGVVSKYEQDLDPTLNLPENVLAFNTRMTLQGAGFALDAEYAHKVNDPKTTNGNSYNPGRALYVNGSYSAPGLGINVSLKSLDNMDFRSSRRSQLTDLVLNYLPAVTKQYTYRLLTLYPYATQPYGEIGVQADILYTFPKGSFLGGQYGTSINVNYSRVHSIDSSRNLSDSASIEGNLYNTKFLSFGKRVFFDDFNVEVQKKWSKDFKTNFGFMKQYYLKELIELLPGTGAIRSTVITSEFIYSMTKTQTIRFELQHMSVDHRYIDNEGNELDRELDANGKTVHPKLDNNNGNWIYALAEYTVAPKWFISLFNEYNYGNEDPNRRLNYLSGNIIYVKDAMRLTLGYGRVRGGILCVGGVCRPVPASNGFSLSVSSTF
ncbi:MAG: hypothetical protein EBU66_01705 [Bacteroidetes bacterium]|nr:hypothetical protein [Bacteroidota bacterium]